MMENFKFFYCDYSHCLVKYIDTKD